jgi:hypothetical protein
MKMEHILNIGGYLVGIYLIGILMGIGMTIFILKQQEKRKQDE